MLHSALLGWSLEPSSESFCRILGTHLLGEGGPPSAEAWTWEQVERVVPLERVVSNNYCVKKTHGQTAKSHQEEFVFCF